MALTGHLSDLSLSELIEFFCNQRKTGCLNVLYPQGHGSFYLQTGSVVDAKIGVLRGIDAVYYALTLPNAAFEFKSSAETPERTINQPWTQVVLEGLRRLDEGITPTDAFPDGPLPDESAEVMPGSQSEVSQSRNAAVGVPSFLAAPGSSSVGSRKPLIAGAVAVAILASVVVIGVPAGWYRRNKPVVTAPQNVEVAAAVQPVANPAPADTSPTSPVVDTHAAEAAALAAKHQREKERAKVREANSAAESAAAHPGATVTPPTASNNPESKPGPKKVTVQVSYDESGRVTQASGADPTAVRIARQRHFPPGKAGSASITISMN
ncbi:MAG: Roadblock/LC7 domain protein [Acidobacteria bacterium]|nr:Roadblock/LC7 domain protein [Acidobacteriota bacterium]